MSNTMYETNVRAASSNLRATMDRNQATSLDTSIKVTSAGNRMKMKSPFKTGSLTHLQLASLFPPCTFDFACRRVGLGSILNC